MALDFPNSPTIGDVYTFESRAWRYNGRAWEAIKVNAITLITNIDGGRVDEDFGAAQAFDGGGVD